MRTHVSYILIGLTLALFMVQPASAGKRQFSLDPYGFRRLNGASADLGSFGLGGITLPSGSGAQIAMGFIIPKPYRSNTDITISVSWHTADPNCSIEFQPDFVDRSRPGHLVTFGNPSGGLTPADSSIVLVAGPIANRGNVKDFVLGPDQGFDQQSGDSILLGFARGTGSGDTCPGDLIVTGVNIQYLTP